MSEPRPPEAAPAAHGAPQAEAAALAAAIRRVVRWDAEDGLVGYPSPAAGGWERTVALWTEREPAVFERHAAPVDLGAPAAESADAAWTAPEADEAAASAAPASPLDEAPSEAPPQAHAEPADGAPTRQARPLLPALREELGDCRRCKLSGLGRTQLVFGEGNPSAELMFVGEGPGFFEDQTGRPFVGKAGELLDKMINAMGLARGDVYICNVVKCRPPENRNPEPDEIVACQPFLHAQVRSVRPRVIVALGKFAAQVLLASTDPISRLRGRWFEYVPGQAGQGGAPEAVPLMPTFHPAYLLRNPDDKKLCWADLKLVMAALDLPRPAP